MGAEPWQYFVPYEEDVERALQQLRQQEFQAGRFLGSEMGPETIEAALELMEDCGTRSILDMERVANRRQLGAVAPLSERQLIAFFGTARPSRAVVEENDRLFEQLDRGQGVYVVVYKDEVPVEICFAGYSYD
jgi:hypothetical protein